MNSAKSFFSPNVFDSVKVEFHQFTDLDALAFNEEKNSCKELKKRVENLAELINPRVPEEKIIAVSCTRSIQTIVNILALLYSGKAYLPIDFELPEERLQKIFSDTKVKFGLPENSHESFDSLVVTDINNALLDKENTDNVLAEQAYMLFTSGSTGSTLYIAENSTLKDSLLLLEFVEKNEIIRVFFPFVALQGLCNAANAYQIYPKSLKEIMTAGEQLKVSLAVRKFYKNLEGCVLLNQYGPTETTSIITELRLEGDPDQWEDLPTIGKAISNSDLVLVDEEGKLNTKFAMIGEIYISGIGLAIGYFNNPTLTSEKFVEVSFKGKEAKRYFKTGDLAESDLVIFSSFDSAGSPISIFGGRSKWINPLNLKNRLNSQGLDQSSRNLGVNFILTCHPSSGRNVYQS